MMAVSSTAIVLLQSTHRAVLALAEAVPSPVPEVGGPQDSVWTLKSQVSFLYCSTPQAFLWKRETTMKAEAPWFAFWNLQSNFHPSDMSPSGRGWGKRSKVGCFLVALHGHRAVIYIPVRFLLLKENRWEATRHFEGCRNLIPDPRH